MSLFNKYDLNVFFIQLNFLFLFSVLIILSIIIYLVNYFYFKLFYKDSVIYYYIKFILIVFIIVSFLLFLLNLWVFLDYFNSYNKFIFYNNYLNIISIEQFCQISLFSSILFIDCSIDLFGLTLLLLSYIVGFISLLALDTRLYWKNFKYNFTFSIFLIIVYLYTTTNNLLLLFIFYEFLLIPSFFFVYFVSPSRRAIQASIYFVIWTQLGSFLVLGSCLYIIFISGTSEFDMIRRYQFSYNEVFILYTTIFLGFGFKVPIWPFHYWLTKTHVEAPSGFSIYLSGFLVKSALYGFYKISILFSVDINSTIFILICILGVIDSSLKMWGQTDIKKLVAFGTIQEMNLIFLAFCWGDSFIVTVGIIFTITHAFLSSLMFYLVDCVYRRYYTRSIVEINGILHITPNLGIFILIMVIFFSGLPGTIKFISEFYLFSGFFEVSPILCCFLMFIANVLGLIGFSKIWFNLVFGGFTKFTKYLPMDLSIRETYIITSNFLFLVLCSYLPIVLF